MSNGNTNSAPEDLEEKQIKECLAQLRQKLLDLSLRNTLLNYKDRKHSIKLINELPNIAFNSLVSQSAELTLLPFSGEAPNGEQLYNKSSEKNIDLKLQTALILSQLEKRCSKLRLDTKTALEETGCNFLYLNIGFLNWYESEDSDIELKAPLILIPLNIERTKIKKRTDYFIYKVSYTGEDFLENVSLAEKLNKDFGIELPSFADEIVPEDYLQAVESAIFHKKRWRIDREMVISTFSFSKIVMFKDLDLKNWPSDFSPMKKNLIKALCTGADLGEANSALQLQEKELTSIDYSLILDADSSQTRAIEEILKGKNYVVHGPPGTGKSQTISNLIACALDKGKSVLFVAEKKAALEVVKKRLDWAGLGDLCLELHSHKINKGLVFKDLKKRLGLSITFDLNKLDKDIKKIESLKKRLSDYVIAINKKIDHNLTVHDVLWAAERSYKSGYETLIKPIDNLVQHAVDMDLHTDLLSSIVNLYNELTKQKVESWKWFSSKNILPNDIGAVGSCIRELTNLLDSGISRFTGYLEKGCPFDLCLSKIEECSSIKDYLDKVEEFLNISRKSMYYFNPKYWKLKRYLNAIICESDPIKKKQISKDFSKLLKKSRSKSEQDISALLKFLFSFKLSTELISWCFEGNISAKLNILKDLIEYTFEFQKKFTQISGRLGAYGQIDTDTFTDSKTGNKCIRTLSVLLRESLESINTLPLWSEYCQLGEKAKNNDLIYCVKLLNKGKISSENLINFHKYNIYSELSKSLIQKSPILSEFSRIDHEQATSSFRQVDKAIVQMTGKRIAGKILNNGVPPLGTKGGKVAEYTEMQLINNETRKQRAYVPIRQLVKRAGRALQVLKPCFMMSPMSVAQFLSPGQLEFDLMIMDEASQILPEDAMGALARCKQVVVVGDPKQLPPTTFFTKNMFADEDGEEIYATVESESILDRADTFFASSRLQWHYRSKHESLINFSNRMFYDDELIIFPSPYPVNRQYGVSCHFVPNAFYSKGRNFQEAVKVVEKIIEHFRINPNLSLGVVTFNLKQRDLIQELLDKAIKSNPNLDELTSNSVNELEPFFIKNLENVQGDERDVIIISTTFGPDPETKGVYQRFGPIAGDYGWRRLNVMVTRARMKVLVITSMNPEDILEDPEKAFGVRALRNYLYYAKYGHFEKEGHVTGGEPQSDFEIAVISELNKLGYKCAAQVGVAGYKIDIGVFHPKERTFLLGIECDGATYHSAKNARDRDRLRQEILEAKGWKIHRIWSTDWFRNREHEISRLQSAINKAFETAPTEPITEPQIKKPIAKKIAELFTIRSDQDLRDKLKQYKKYKIDPKYSDSDKCILRNDMMDALIKHKPSNKTEFLSRIPLYLREKTNHNRMEFIEDIFEIIEEFT